MKTIKERVIAEKLELDERIRKLSGFINTNASYTTLSEAARDLLVAQEDTMVKYSHILRDRLALLTVESPDE